MKNTFKHIFTAIAFSSAALASGVSLHAQNLEDGVYLEPVNTSGTPTGIAYRKTASLKDVSTNTYTVNLEAFVTGEVTVENVSVPADIVLVLDVSGSMDDHMYKYTARPSQAYTYNSYGNNSYYYLHTDGNYYEVERNGNNTRRLRFRVGNTWYYLYGTGVTTQNQGVSGINTTIWTGVLYSREDIGTKMENLKTAVKAFIDKIQENDLYEEDENGNLVRRKDEDGNEIALGNQISIVKFGYATYNGSTTQASITPGNHFYHIYSSGWSTQYEYTTTYQQATDYSVYYNCTEVRVGFTPTENDSDVNMLKNAVDGFVASGATAADYGMNLARLLLADLVAREPDRKSSKTVVFFTDGTPTHGSEYEANVANAAIENSYQIKNNTTTNPFEATVFSVGVFSEETTQINTFMRRVSSNYLAARNMSDNVNEVSTKYYMNASNADLSDVFTTIAQASGGSGSSLGESSVVTIDVVASSFSIPSEAANMSVTVAPCTGADDKDPGETETIGGQSVRKRYLNFGEAKEATQYGLPAITLETGKNKEGQDTVATKNFNFSEHWCGYDAGNSKWHGYKQIISFDVQVNADAVGGPNVATNDASSGIYVTDEAGNKTPVAVFNRPNVVIPISIWIKKKGLIENDSAVFNIQYAEYEAGVDPRDLPSSAWKSFTKAIINSNSPKDTDGYPMIKIVGLDPNYFYRIKEDAWAWTYEYVTGGDEAHQAGGRLYIFGEDQKNPFVFENKSQKDTKVKEHEATVKNVFGDNYEVVYPE